MASSCRLAPLVCALLVSQSALLGASDIQPVSAPRSAELGRAPTLPPAEELSEPSALRQIIGRATAGYEIDTTQRESVRSFYNTVYLASENQPMGWTGAVPGCDAGTTADEYRDAVARRINWYRAMAGVPAVVTLDGGFNSQAQEAALMMSANDSLSHTPPDTWTCWTEVGSTAAGSSNLSLVNAGPDAVRSQMRDNGGGNAAGGHRRWLLLPQTERMGSGDVDARDEFRAANAVWVFDGRSGAPRPETRETWVAWPPPGYVPWQAVYARWSLSYADADLSAATVSMTRDGEPLEVSVEPYDDRFGEPTLLWYTELADPYDRGAWPATPDGRDEVYVVRVEGIAVGNDTIEVEYSVTVFDPQVVGDDGVLPVVTGPVEVPVGDATSFAWNEVPGADGYRAFLARRAPWDAIQGAEGGTLGAFEAETTPGYEPVVGSPVSAGSYAYHLVQPEPEDQWLTLGPMLLASASSELRFQSRLGVATENQVARVQISLDGGGSWAEIWSQPGVGQPGETAWSSRSVPLADYAGRAIRLRFGYTHTRGGSFFPQTFEGIGWHIDEVEVRDAEELVVREFIDTGDAVSNDIAVPSEGSWAVGVQARVWADFFAEIGPLHAIEAMEGQQGGSVPGDCNNDATLDLSDGVCLIGYLFQGTPVRLPCGDGTAADASNIALLDANGDLGLNLSDAIHLFGYLFLGRAPHVLGTECRSIEGCSAVCGP